MNSTSIGRRNRLSPSQIKAARDGLLDLVADFPFASLVCRAAWLAGLLTPFARSWFAGPAPLFLIDSDQRGPGPAVLAHLVSIIATGMRMPTMRQSLSNSEELRKLDGIAVMAPPLILVDSILRPLGSAHFDRLLTAERWVVAHRQPNHPALSTKTVWWATGCDVQFRQSCDTERRTLVLRLVWQDSMDSAGCDYAGLVDLAVKRRGRLMNHACTLLRGYQTAPLEEKETVSLPAWGSFESWSELVRGAVVWAGLPDPAGACPAMKAAGTRAVGGAA